MKNLISRSHSARAISKPSRPKFLTSIILAAFVGLSAPAQATLWITDSQTVVLRQFEVFSFHIELFHQGTSWKTINWLTFGQVNIVQQASLDIHLEPGETKTVMTGESSDPFVDEEKFTNIGVEDQTLVGEIKEGDMAPMPFGPAVVGVGDTESVPGVIDDPDMNGLYTMSKEITNVDLNPNWWEVEVTNTWDVIDVIAAGSFTDHHDIPLAIINREWFTIVNIGTTVIEFDFLYEFHSVPEPTPIALLILGLLGVAVTRSGKLNLKETTRS